MEWENKNNKKSIEKEKEKKKKQQQQQLTLVSYAEKRELIFFEAVAVLVVLEAVSISESKGICDLA